MNVLINNYLQKSYGHATQFVIFLKFKENVHFQSCTRWAGDVRKFKKFTFLCLMNYCFGVSHK